MVLDSQHANALGVRKEMIHYGMTKTAQLAVSRGVAESVAGTGVTENTVLPRPTRSEILQNWLEPMAKQTGKSLEGRRSDNHGCLRVFSTNFPATTVAALRVDGGVVRAGTRIWRNK